MKIAEWKSRIDNSIFFSLDPVSQASRRETEKYKLLTEIIKCGYGYVNQLSGKKWNDGCEYGTEVWETAEACLNAFDPAIGQSFSTYYACALRRNLKIWQWKDRLNELAHGLTISKAKLAKVMSLIRDENNRQDGNIDSKEFLAKVVETVNVTSGEAADLMNLVSKKVLEMDASISNEDGDDETEYGDMISDPGAEEAFLTVEGDGTEEFLELLDIVYNGLQERQKPLIGMLLTAKLFEREEIWGKMSECSFYDEEVFHLCLERNESITAREIATRIGKLETAVSRSWNSYCHKVQLWRTA